MQVIEAAFSGPAKEEFLRRRKRNNIVLLVVLLGFVAGVFAMGWTHVRTEMDALPKAATAS